MKTVTKRIRERAKVGMRLGRHVVHDPRSWDYPAKLAKSIRSVTHAAFGLPLDQGTRSSCTGNAAAGAMNSEPYHTKNGGHVYAEDFAVELYHEETVAHPQNGVYPPDDPGGSGLWVAGVLKSQGLIKSYRHAFGIDQALRATVLRPCIFGIRWYSSFDHVNEATGLVQITSRATVRGGHEIVGTQIDAPNKLIWFWQSWGAWGYQKSGRFCMTFDTLDRLLREQGDCTQFVAA